MKRPRVRSLVVLVCMIIIILYALYSRASLPQRILVSVDSDEYNLPVSIWPTRSIHMIILAPAIYRPVLGPVRPTRRPECYFTKEPRVILHCATLCKTAPVYNLQRKTCLCKNDQVTFYKGSFVIDMTKRLQRIMVIFTKDPL